MGELTAKQSLFVAEYLKDLNATQAAIRAGYSPKTAQEQSSRLLSNVMVQKAIEAAKAQRAKQAQITAEQVLADIVSIQKAAMSMKHDNDGNEVMTNPNAALKAAELLGKHLGMWTDKIDHSSKDGTLNTKVLNIHPDSTPEQIEALARGLGMIDDGEYDLNA